MDSQAETFPLPRWSGSPSSRAGPRKWLLGPLALVILLQIDCPVQSRPLGSCYFPQMPEHPNAFRQLRNQYDDERFKGSEPWRNCSRHQLRFPRPKMHQLRHKWDKMEAVEAELALVVPVLQNISDPAFSKHAAQILQFLHPLQEALSACVRAKPSHGQKSSILQQFKEEIQKFKASSVQQSPKCLEAAVGLSIVRLLEEEIRHLRQHFRRHPHTTVRLG